eukprot:351639-Chlamydomonas_euryale.AAC.3
MCGAACGKKARMCMQRWHLAVVRLGVRAGILCCHLPLQTEARPPCEVDPDAAALRPSARTHAPQACRTTVLEGTRKSGRKKRVDRPHDDAD